jgi:hypothetical protein
MTNESSREQQKGIIRNPDPTINLGNGSDKSRITELEHQLAEARKRMKSFELMYENSSGERDTALKRELDALAKLEAIREVVEAAHKVGVHHHCSDANFGIGEHHDNYAICWACEFHKRLSRLDSMEGRL